MEEISRRFALLKRRGFVDINQNPEGSYVVKSTTKGRRQAKRCDLENIVIKTPKSWDKCWRLVIFDIPAVKQKSRFALLIKLKELGFIMLQRSIWAHPFECQNEVVELARAFEVNKYIQYLTCNYVSAGEYLREEFEKRNNARLL